MNVKNLRRKSGRVTTTALIATAGLGVFTPAAFAGTDVPPTGTDGWVQVSTAGQLEYIDQNQSSYLNSNIELMNNIDLSSDSNWVPFGGNSYSPFSGTLNGQGYEVTRLTINDTGDIDVGFIGTSSGTVENLGVEVNLAGSTGNNGGLMGSQLDGSVIDSYSTGTVAGGGGVAGSGTHGGPGGSGGLAGGLVGTQSGGSITDSYSSGTVDGGNGGVGSNGSFSYSGGPGGGGGLAGGLVGTQSGSSITNSYSTRAVIGGSGGSGGTGGPGYLGGPGGPGGPGGSGGSGGLAGGLVGTQSSDTITDSYSIGRVTSGAGGAGGSGGAGPGGSGGTGSPGSGGILGGVGGLVGSQVGGSITDSYFDDQSSNTPAGVNGESTSAMHQTSTYTTNGANWDFTNTWGILSTVNSGYPFLRTFAPVAPSGLSTSDTTSTGTTLSWGSVTDATSYNIYESGDSTPIASGVTGTSYTASGLGPDASYSFTVTAINDSGESPRSSAVTVNTANIGTVHFALGDADALSGSSKTVSGVVYDVYGSPVPNAIIDLSSTIGNWNASSITADGNGAFSVTWTAPTVTTQTSGTVTMSVYGTVYGQVYGVTPTTMTLDVAPPPSITTTTLSVATIGSAYSQSLSATDGFSPYTWSVTAGSLPAGLSLDATTGVISGTPSATGTGHFTIQVQDADGNTATKDFSISVNPAAPPVQTTPAQPSWPPFTGTNGFDTVVSAIWSGPNGTNWSAAGPDGTDILVEVPNGTLPQQGALRLTTADPSTLAALTNGLKNITVLGGYGLNVANDTPNGPIELWFQNAAWVPGTMVYEVNKDVSLTWVPVDTLSSGWLRFAITPNDLTQGGNFVMVLPSVVKTLKVNEGLMEWNGIVLNMPTVRGTDGTYAALFYLMKALRQDGVQSHWNGKAWTLTPSKPITVRATTQTPVSGDIPVIVNGTTVAYVKAKVTPDGWTNKPTTYVTIDTLDSLLKLLFGTAPDWTYGKQ